MQIQVSLGGRVDMIHISACTRALSQLAFCNVQGSTIRKRKLYESFLEKVSILGKF